MRAGWFGNTELQQYLKQATPKAREIVEAVRAVASDIIDTGVEWADSDSYTGYSALASGGARIYGGTYTHLEHTAGSAESENLGFTDPHFAALIDWDPDISAEREIFSVDAYLVAQADAGEAKEVVWWEAQLFRVVALYGESEDYGMMGLAPVSNRVRASAATGGSSPDTITFTFHTDGKWAPRIGEEPHDYDSGESDDRKTGPMTVVILWAVKTNGEPAANAAWIYDSSANFSDKADGRLQGIEFQGASVPAGENKNHTYIEIVDDQIGIPRLSIIGNTYSSQTIEFTAAEGNELDLGAAPTNDVEVVAQAETPSDSSITYELNDGSSWFEVLDGDIIGQDNTDTGGKDLSSMSAVQTYDARVTLSPATDGYTTPTVRRFGVQEIETYDLDGMCIVSEPTWAIDPLELKSEITEVTIEILRTGIQDFRDFATTFASENYINQVEFRLWLGHPNLDRHKWMHIDSFRVDDIEYDGPVIRYICLSVLGEMRVAVPPLTEGTSTREPITYSQDTLKTAYEDIVDGQVGLSGRYRGAGVENEDYTVTHLGIEDSDGKDEADALAFFAGGAIITSQGKIKFQEVFDEEATPLAFMPTEVIDWVKITAGLRNRVPEYFVPYNWSISEDGAVRRYENEVRSYHTNSLSRLGRGGLDSVKVMPDKLSRYIYTEELAEHLGSRMILNAGVGILLWRYRTIYCYPWLEPGDTVVVQTDRFAIQDPNSGEALKGNLYALGVLVEVTGSFGREFVIWIQNYSHITSSDAVIDRVAYAFPTIQDSAVLFDPDGTPTIQLRVKDGASVKVSGSTGDHPVRATVQAESVNAADDDGYVQVTLSGITVSGSDTFYYSALAYELSDGSGKEQLNLYKMSTKAESWFLTAQPILDQDAEELYLQPNRPAWSSAIYWKVYTSGTPTKSDVMGTGTLSTGDNINVHTFTSDGESVTVAMVAVENTDGSGASGDLRTRVWTYTSAARVTVSWLKYEPGEGNEGVRIIARSTGSTVRIYYRTYTDGDTPPGWSDTGLVSDPAEVTVSVTRPDEGASNEIIEFYGEDADGNTSGDPYQLIVDPGKMPRGIFSTDVNSDHEAIIKLSRLDPDTGSWRLKVKRTTNTSDFDTIGYVDSSTELAGNTFNGETPDLSAFPLTGDYVLNCELKFFNTTSTTASDQQNSIMSDPLRFTLYPQQGLRPPTFLLIPSQDPVSDPGEGVATIVPNDPNGYITGTAFEVYTGDGGTWEPPQDPGSWSTTYLTSPYTYEHSVTLVEGHNTKVLASIRYDIGDGNGNVWGDAKEVVFDRDLIPKLLAASLSLDGDDVYFSGLGDEDTGSVKYITSTSSMPSEGDLDSGGSYTNDRSFHVLVEGALAEEQTLYIRARAYSGANATGTPQAAADWTDRVTRPPDTDTIVPTVEPTYKKIDDSGTIYGNVELTVNDPDGVQTGSAFDIHSGSADYDPGDPSTWDETDTTPSYATSHSSGVQLLEKHSGIIFWGVRYNLNDGEGERWITGSHNFGIIAIPSVSASLSLTGNQAYLSWTGDVDLGSIEYVADTSEPSNFTGSSTSNGRSGKIAVGGALSDGDTLYVLLRGWSGTGGAGTASVSNWEGQIKYEAGTPSDDLPPLGVLLTYTWKPSPSAGGTHELVLHLQVGNSVASADIYVHDGTSGYHYTLDSITGDMDHTVKASSSGTTDRIWDMTDGDPIILQVTPWSGAGETGSEGTTRHMDVFPPKDSGVGAMAVAQSGTEYGGRILRVQKGFDIVQHSTEYDPFLQFVEPASEVTLTSDHTVAWSDGAFQRLKIEGNVTLDAPDYEDVPVGQPLYIYLDLSYANRSLTLESGRAGWQIPYDTYVFGTNDWDWLFLSYVRLGTYTYGTGDYNLAVCGITGKPA